MADSPKNGAPNINNLHRELVCIWQTRAIPDRGSILDYEATVETEGDLDPEDRERLNLFGGKAFDDVDCQCLFYSSTNWLWGTTVDAFAYYSGSLFHCFLASLEHGLSPGPEVQLTLFLNLLTNYSRTMSPCEIFTIDEVRFLIEFLRLLGSPQFEGVFADFLEELFIWLSEQGGLDSPSMCPTELGRFRDIRGQASQS